MHGGSEQQLAAEAGAIEAVVAALQAHPQEVEVQEQGCRALRNVCFSAPTPQGAHASSAQLLFKAELRKYVYVCVSHRVTGIFCRASRG